MKTFIIAVLLLLTMGCSSLAVRNERYASSHSFTQLEIRGGDFTHVVYFNSRGLNKKRGLKNKTGLNSQRLHSRWHVYIEGDGRPWRSRYTVASDPTIEKPLMLRMMVKDAAPSIYLGRPCYHGMVGEVACHPWFWTHGRYSESVVASMVAALEKLIKSQQIEQLTLIGHSGGAALAMLLAEHIQQTRMLITIAGNLDINQWTSRHGYSHLEGSLNPIDRPLLSQSITQFHFTGKLDTNVSPEPVQQLQKNYPDLNHIQVESAGHNTGWDNYFCQLLQITGSQCLSTPDDELNVN